MVRGEDLGRELQGGKEMQTRAWEVGHSGSQGEPGPFSPGLLASGSWLPPYYPVLSSNLATPSRVSPPDNHKPIWMHAEEREAMSKVSWGGPTWEPEATRPLSCSCTSLPAPHFPPEGQPQTHGAFPSPACTKPSTSLHPSISVLSSLASPPPLSSCRAHTGRAAHPTLSMEAGTRPAK